MDDIDWGSVGKALLFLLGGAALGGTAYWVGTQVGHSDGMKDGYCRASDEYDEKFEDQERRFRKESAELDGKIDTIIERVKGANLLCPEEMQEQFNWQTTISR